MALTEEQTENDGQSYMLTAYRKVNGQDAVCLAAWGGTGGTIVSMSADAARRLAEELISYADEVQNCIHPAGEWTVLDNAGTVRRFINATCETELARLMGEDG